MNQKIVDELIQEYAVKSGQSLSGLLYDIVLHDKTYWDMRANLQSPKTVGQLAGLLLRHV